MALPDPKLPGDYHYDAPPELAIHEYKKIIMDGIAGHERNHQRRIGPSGIGTPCVRKLGAQVAQLSGSGVPSWRSFVGTAVHEKLETFFDAQNGLWPDNQRYATEQKVAPGFIDGETIDGSCDLFDMVTGFVIDWKTTSKTKLAAYKRNGPGDQYRIQAHSYGRGWERAGHVVMHVGIVFFPRDGNFEDAYWWHEPYDRTVADAAFARADAIAVGQRMLGIEVFQRTLPATEDHCDYCPIYSPTATDYSDIRKCPGARQRASGSSSSAALDKLTGK